MHCKRIFGSTPLHSLFRGLVIAHLTFALAYASAPSPIAQAIKDAVNVPGIIANSPVPQNLISSSDNSLDSVMKDGPEIFSRIRTLIAGAKHEVCMGWYNWTPGCEAVKELGRGLAEASNGLPSNRRLVIRLLLDALDWKTGGKFATLTSSIASWNLNPDKATIYYTLYSKSLIGSYHTKMVVVDGRYLAITGANPEEWHHPPHKWHDTGYVFTGTVTRAALADFDEAFFHHNVGQIWTVSSDPDAGIAAYNAPNRAWIDNAPTNGNVWMLAAGRLANGNPFSNAIDNPQDAAWIAAMKAATAQIDVISPNINDDAFHRSVVDAVKRGVKVRLITTKEFNQGTSGFLGQGGNNDEALGRLRTALRDIDPSGQFFEFRWFGLDGQKPEVGDGKEAVNGKFSLPAHVKFMSVDRSVAIVGSGNMDTQSWNHSREFNVVIDGAANISEIQSRIFDTDWARSVPSIMELYDANNGNGGLVVTATVSDNHRITYGLGTNDEARSAVLRHVSAGRVIRVYDDSGASVADDWTEIQVKRPIAFKLLSTFQETREDDEIRMVYHRGDNLDGKVSRIDFDSSLSRAHIALYDGNELKGGKFTELQIGPPRTKQHPIGTIKNDAARSLALYNAAKGRHIFIYDNSDDPDRSPTERKDDWTEIEVLKDVWFKAINTFEKSFSDDDVRVTYHKDNGLDGKVSRVYVD